MHPLMPGDIVELFVMEKTKKLSTENAAETMAARLEPLVIMTIQNYPLYLREDLAQELRIDIFNKFRQFAREYNSGAIGDIIKYICRALTNTAIDFVRKQNNIECKLVRMEDLQIEPVIYPKTYEKSKLIAKIRRALEYYYLTRYTSKDYSNRASRFAYTILNGKRPVLMTNNLTRFFHGNRIMAQQAYTSSLLIIKMILQRRAEEVECILKG